VEGWPTRRRDFERRVIFGWRYRNDTYPRGHALMLNRADPHADFAFRVHDATAEPGS
jgi:hypothetical protein